MEQVFHPISKTNCKLISEHRGFVPSLGKDFGKEKNPYKIYEDKYGKFVEMVSSNDKIFIFDEDKLKIITEFKTQNGHHVSWYIAKVGTTRTGKILYYVATRDGSRSIYLHELILGKKQGYTIDHIDSENRMNNRLLNLRHATQSEQNHNRGKVSRKKNSHPYPDGLTHDMIPKYVYYQWDSHGQREFFVIEKHPLQILKIEKKRWLSSKSMKKYNILEKLQKTKEKLEEMENTFKRNIEYQNMWKSYLKK